MWELKSWSFDSFWKRRLFKIQRDFYHLNIFIWDVEICRERIFWERNLQETETAGNRNCREFNLQGTESAGNGICRKRNLQGTKSAGNGICRERKLQGTETAGNRICRESKLKETLKTGICREWNLQGMEPKLCHFVFCLLWIIVIMLRENLWQSRFSSKINFIAVS